MQKCKNKYEDLNVLNVLSTIRIYKGYTHKWFLKKRKTFTPTYYLNSSTEYLRPRRIVRKYFSGACYSRNFSLCSRNMRLTYTYYVTLIFSLKKMFSVFLITLLLTRFPDNNIGQHIIIIIIIIIILPAATSCRVR